ncbi:MAG: 4-hydroxythreonine-4-phosphate dehydrogenase PdxA [Robiginitomaculum sp.]|nr:4-hydroxythreonine-4-phosphate dehydrogenase PdxA [Robiginitomaculum sp.]
MKSANKNNTLPIALSMGDPAGIGPEITARAWAKLHQERISFFLIGDLELAQQQATRLGLPAPIAISDPLQAIQIMPSAMPVLPLSLAAPVMAGSPDTANAPMVIASIEKAAHLVMNGQASALVTNPIAKSVLYEAGFAHPGHTEFLGELAKEAKVWPRPHGPIMMLCGGGLRVALVTVHIPLHQVPGTLSKDNIMQAAQVLHQALKRDFGLENPRLALCGLNPHAGENGTMGEEELKIINPAATDLRAQGINITDAQPADALFREDARAGYDAVLALYHDQGLIPVKTLDFHGGINATLGLPFIRVSPDHGTGFAIAGQGIARPDSLIAALREAASMSTHRQAHDRA